jgi:hypothetical protein
MSNDTHVLHPPTLERLEHRDKPITTADVIKGRQASDSIRGWRSRSPTESARCGAPMYSQPSLSLGHPCI